MLAVSDTSTLCYLILIKQIHLLPQLYQQVCIPTAVYQELRTSGTPESVKTWIAALPDWLFVQSVALSPEQDLALLDVGEREAIALAEHLQADVILLDERRGRTLATARGLRVVGLLGVLGAAAELDLADFSTAISCLQTTNFWVSPKLLKRLLEHYS
mgnify:CR=1 FL=1